MICSAVVIWTKRLVSILQKSDVGPKFLPIAVTSAEEESKNHGGIVVQYQPELQRYVLFVARFQVAMPLVSFIGDHNSRSLNMPG